MSAGAAAMFAVGGAAVALEQLLTVP